jgi:oligopeptide/dipeptide ABC transporter ATP-binding protein
MTVVQRAPIISVRHLSASYSVDEEALPAVRDVSLELYPGEVLALVGESAAGKSTIAHAILGLLPFNATIDGSIEYRGRAITEMPPEELRDIRGDEIAMIFQDAQSALTPTLTVGDQVSELIRAHRDTGDAEAMRASVALLDEVLPDGARVAELYPGQLSGGMAQRVMITLATALNPSVIIADEPTANLDPGVRMETLARLEALRDSQEVSILLITHDFGVVARLADRVAVMYAGAIVETADVRTIFREPRHPYTHGLLESLPTLEGGRDRLASMRGQPPDLATLGEECPFLPRCNKATSACRTEPAPALDPFEGDPDHLLACYNPIVVERD